MAAWTQRLPGTRSRSAAIWATLLSAFPALVPERRGAHTVLTALLDRSALYGVLVECETLGLDLVEVRGGAKEVGVAEGHLGGAESHLGAGLLGQETGGDGARVGEVDDDLVTPRGRGVAAVDREHPQRAAQEAEGDQLAAGAQPLVGAQEERDPGLPPIGDLGAHRGHGLGLRAGIHAGLVAVAGVLPRTACRTSIGFRA